MQARFGLRLSLLIMAAALPMPADAAQLVHAVRAADHAALARLLAEQPDVDERAADGAAALHWAVYLDDLHAAGALIEAGADLTATNLAGATPLFLASVAGNDAMVELLLAGGADANETFRNGETMLMLAARAGRVAAVESLLAHGADVDAAESLRGTTALMWAAANGHSAVVAALLAHGADVGARAANIPRGRGPYLAPTAKSRIEDFLRGVGQAGESIPIDLDGDGIADREIGRAAAPDVPFLSDARIAELQAARTEDRDSDRAFRDARPNDHGGLTPLVFAAREGDLASAVLLLDAGADVNQRTRFGWSALLAATHTRHYALGRLLLERGADPNIANRGGWTPLYIATDNRNIEGGDYPTRRPDIGHLEYIRLLLAHGADSNARMASSTETRTIFTHQWLREDGATPFLRAAQSGDVELMRLLLAHGADPDIATDNGTTALMVASGIGWVEGVTYEWSQAQTRDAIELLLELGADVNAQDADGRTALMGAAHKGRPDIVQRLFDAGADLAVRDYGSRDSIHKLFGTRWQAIDYADGLVRVGVQSADAHPQTAALLRQLMRGQGLETPPEGRTLDSICVVDVCR